jgi:hypothetical protein
MAPREPNVKWLGDGPEVYSYTNRGGFTYSNLTFVEQQRFVRDARRQEERERIEFRRHARQERQRQTRERERQERETQRQLREQRERELQWLNLPDAPPPGWGRGGGRGGGGRGGGGPPTGGLLNMPVLR